MRFFSKKNQAFTLIELMVVMSIIAILSVIVMISMSGVRQKSRDLKRVSDVKTIQSALQMYMASVGYYPTAITAGDTIANPNNGIVYLQSVPSNPLPRNEGSCVNKDYYYLRTSPSSYSICFCLGAQTGSVGSGSHALSSDGKIVDCGCKIADSDGNEYDTVKIGNQCWMKDNLKVGSRINGVVQQGDPAIQIQKYCYDDENDNCASQGALYQWHTAMKLFPSCDTNSTNGCVVDAVHQGICPAGWHIPNKADWLALANYVGGLPIAGKKLKVNSTREIYPWDGTDNYGFSAIAAGVRTSGIYNSRGSGTYFWSATNEDYLVSTAMGLSTGSDGLNNNLFNPRTNAYSVRCVKN